MHVYRDGDWVRIAEDSGSPPKMHEFVNVRPIVIRGCTLYRNAENTVASDFIAGATIKSWSGIPTINCPGTPTKYVPCIYESWGHHHITVYGTKAVHIAWGSKRTLVLSEEGLVGSGFPLKLGVMAEDVLAASVSPGDYIS